VASGRFITLEGGEGAGKSTHVDLLIESLDAAGITAVKSQEPGGGSAEAEKIRALLVEGDVGRWDPVAEALLHSAARRDHLVNIVWPALELGHWVVSDRFADSTMAYQGYGHGLDRAAIEQLYEITVGDFRPDLTIVLDLPAEEGLKRAGKRGGNEDRYERMGLDFHERLRDGFLDIARREPERCVVIDARPPREQVQAAIRDCVAERLEVEFP
jgi:dTMP kinase